MPRSFPRLVGKRRAAIQDSNSARLLIELLRKTSAGTDSLISCGFRCRRTAIKPAACAPRKSLCVIFSIYNIEQRQKRSRSRNKATNHDHRVVLLHASLTLYSMTGLLLFSSLFSFFPLIFASTVSHIHLPCIVVTNMQRFRRHYTSNCMCGGEKGPSIGLLNAKILAAQYKVEVVGNA